VLLLATVIILSAFLFLPAYFATTRTHQDKERNSPNEARRSVPQPFVLASRLRCEEDRFATLASGSSVGPDVDRQAQQALSALREAILYTLDGVAQVEDNPEYVDLATRAMSLCDSLSTIPIGGSPSAAMTAAIREAQALRRLASSISNSVKRR
jgi:hypothetical protein